nr:MAG: IrrE N-terminal-like domain [Bacteriophage sp.]
MKRLASLWKNVSPVQYVKYLICGRVKMDKNMQQSIYVVKFLINSLAEDVLSAYNISVPIGNIDEIVEKLGGTIQKEAFFSDGAVEKEGNGFKIIVSPFQDEKRERFTIAHELGHLFLHMGYRTNNELWEKQENNIYHRIGNSEKEYQANEFAAAFLMPATEYLAVLNKVAEGNMVDTSKIAEYFNVSIEAAANRGKFLGYLRW